MFTDYMKRQKDLGQAANQETNKLRKFCINYSFISLIFKISQMHVITVSIVIATYDILFIICFNIQYFRFKN